MAITSDLNKYIPKRVRLIPNLHIKYNTGRRSRTTITVPRGSHASSFADRLSKLDDDSEIPYFDSVNNSMEYINAIKRSLRLRDKLPFMYILALSLSKSGLDGFNVQQISKKEGTIERELIKLSPAKLENLLHTISNLDTIASDPERPYPSMNMNTFLLPYENKLANLEREIDQMGDGKYKGELCTITDDEIKLNPKLFWRYEPSLFLNILSNPRYFPKDLMIKDHDFDESGRILRTNYKNIFVPSFISEREAEERPNDNIAFHRFSDEENKELNPNSSSNLRMTLGANIFAMPSPHFLKIAYLSTKNQLSKRDNAKASLETILNKSDAESLNDSLKEKGGENKADLFYFMKESRHVNSFQSWAFNLKAPHLTLKTGSVIPEINMFGLTDYQIQLLDSWGIQHNITHRVFKGTRDQDFESDSVPYEVIPLSKFQGPKESMLFDKNGHKLSMPAIRKVLSSMSSEMKNIGELLVSKDSQDLITNELPGLLYSNYNKNSRHHQLALGSMAIWIKEYVPYILIDKNEDGLPIVKGLKAFLKPEDKRFI